jgi:signal transduction histidine kinase
VLTQIGVPFMNRRNRMDREKAGGLGLGLFIAKTLLERSGATLTFPTDRRQTRCARSSQLAARENGPFGCEF